MASIFKKSLGRKSNYSETVPPKKEYMILWLSKINSVESGILSLHIKISSVLLGLFKIRFVKYFKLKK
jgi:hypothetical protein